MMRFRKGSEVEVFSKSEVDSGSWRCGEIISGNGHNYDIRYNFSLGVTGAPIVERVSRKAIRPCPPLVNGLDNWVPGDLVEVFDNMSWKVAIVMKLMGGDHLIVRLVGSCQEIEVHNSELRVRLSWRNNEWVIVGKGPRICEEGRSNRRSISKHQNFGCDVVGTGAKRMLPFEDTCLPVENNLGVQESRIVSSRTLKRGSPDDSHADACMGSVLKMRAMEKDGRQQRMDPERPSILLEKGRSWRLVRLASKGLKMIVGSATFLSV